MLIDQLYKVGLECFTGCREVIFTRYAIETKRKDSEEMQSYRAEIGDTNLIEKAPGEVDMKWNSVTQGREGRQQEAD